jgi:hypothetical protein
MDKETLKIGAGKRGPGRPKGSVNKVTGMLKDAILAAAERAGGEGGIVAYLEKQALENPGPFMTLLGKVLPTQIVDEKDEPLIVEIRKFYEPHEQPPMRLIGN